MIWATRDVSAGEHALHGGLHITVDDHMGAVGIEPVYQLGGSHALTQDEHAVRIVCALVGDEPSPLYGRGHASYDSDVSASKDTSPLYMGRYHTLEAMPAKNLASRSSSGDQAITAAVFPRYKGASQVAQ